MPDGPYARISVIRPHDGDTVGFEAGYIRHLEWHRQNKDTWSWYGWTVWAGDRQRWFVYATFGHAAADFDNPVDPAGDERDNIVNVTPHGAFVGSALYEFLPALSRGTGVPEPMPRVELMTVDLTMGGEKAFEAALDAEQPQGETLWYRMLAGGTSPRYLRLRPRAKLSMLIEDRPGLPGTAKTTIEILTLRPPMCYGLEVR